MSYLCEHRVLTGAELTDAVVELFDGEKETSMEAREGLDPKRVVEIIEEATGPRIATEALANDAIRRDTAEMKGGKDGKKRSWPSSVPAPSATASGSTGTWTRT